MIFFLRPAKHHRGAARYHDKSLAVRSTVGLMEVREGGKEGRPAGRLPRFSQLLASCVSLHVFSCLCCVDADSFVAAAPTHFTVYTGKMNQLTVADVLFSPDLDVLRSAAMSRPCPCMLATIAFRVFFNLILFFLAANLQRIHTKSRRGTQLPSGPVWLFFSVLFFSFFDTVSVTVSPQR